MTAELDAVASRGQAVVAWYFRDSSGELVLGEPPNLAIKVVMGLWVGRWALNRGALRRGSPLDIALERGGRAAFAWWSLDELVRGRTPYRRTLGAAGLLYGWRRRRRAG